MPPVQNITTSLPLSSSLNFSIASGKSRKESKSRSSAFLKVPNLTSYSFLVSRSTISSLLSNLLLSSFGDIFWPVN